MIKILLDSTFFEALILKNHPQHQIAELITTRFQDEFVFYVPFHVFTSVIALCDNEKNSVKEDVIHHLYNCCRVQHYKNSKYPYDEVLERYTSSDLKLSFQNCLTLEFMKQQSIRAIISFDEIFDSVKGVNRVYDLDEYNPNLLNFFKYSD